MDIFDFLFGVICGADALEEAFSPKSVKSPNSPNSVNSVNSSYELTEEDIDAIFNSENDDSVF